MSINWISRRLQKLYVRMPPAAAENHDLKTYGNAFYQLLQGVHAAQGDPNRITDPSQIWSHVGQNGDISLAGADRLLSEMNGKKSSPEGEADAKMKAGALSYAKNEISNEKGISGSISQDSRSERRGLIQYRVYPGLLQSVRAMALKQARRLIKCSARTVQTSSWISWLAPTSERQRRYSATCWMRTTGPARHRLVEQPPLQHLI